MRDVLANRAPLVFTGEIYVTAAVLGCGGRKDLAAAFRAANPTAVGSPFTAGDVFYAQGWMRDPAAPKSTNLSNGLEFNLAP